MKSSSSAVRFSATIPQVLHDFLETYQHNHGLESRSAALSDAIAALQERELLRSYKDLGKAQRNGLEAYPGDNSDGLDSKDKKWR